MVLKISCPSCKKAYRLTSPYPPAGKRYRCTCNTVITVVYPPDVAEMLIKEAPPPSDRKGSAVSSPAETHPSPNEVADDVLETHSYTFQTGSRINPDDRQPVLRDEKTRPVESPAESAFEDLRGADEVLPRTAPSPDAPPGKRRLRVGLYVGLVAFLLVLIGVPAAFYATLWYYSRNLPSLDALQTFRPAIPSQVFARDGELIGEYYGEERRYVLKYEDIPPLTIQAFVAAEDASFFEHHGIDYGGILRALWINIRTQRMAQGASTITQQVARSFLLTREKKLERKIMEAILAYRIETAFPKEHTLYLYLNQVYLGEGAYGVQAAARVYFGRDIHELSLSEVALLAGLCPAPSRYSPVDHFSVAKERQRYVLESMVKSGYITEDQAKSAEASELHIQPRVEFKLTHTPFVTEQVRRYLVDKYGDQQVLEGGLRVETTIDLDLQLAAQDALKSGVRKIDHRIGFRGALEQIPLSGIRGWAERYEADFKKRLQQSRPGGIERWGEPPAEPIRLLPGDVHRAIVQDAQELFALVLVGSQEAILPLDNMLWGYMINPERYARSRKLDHVTRVLTPGDVIEVKVVSLSSDKVMKIKGNKYASRLEVALEQEPNLEAAIFSYQVDDGSIVAMVGGYDFTKSEFNRPYQALRQFGSAFKPLVYSAALDHPHRVYTPATILLDAPITLRKEKEDAEGDLPDELWKPSNYDMDYMGEITLRRALYLSRNTVAVRVLNDIGVEYAYDYVRKLGIDSPVNKDTSMVLGTSSVTLVEMCRAYSVFASGGSTVEPVLITRVTDRDGKVLEERPEKPVKKAVIPPATAFIMTMMLQDVVRMGTATKALELQKPTAGKTGTTNDFRDASYIGFTPQLVTGVWVGYDQPASMGWGQTGGDVALPIWVDYMKAALKVFPNTNVAVPGDIVFADVDEATGKLAGPASARHARLPFEKGEEPNEEAPAPGQITVEDFLSADQEL